MSGSGRWSQQIEFRNCGNSRCLQGCVESQSTKPHGPYATLRRRNPESGEQERVYLGKAPLTEDQLQIVNIKFLGPDAPKKEQLLKTISLLELSLKEEKPVHLGRPTGFPQKR